MKSLILTAIMGIMYYFIEVLYRGFSHWSMIIVGGLCAMLIGLLNERKAFHIRKIWEQSLIGTIIVLILEFISGCIVNLWLGWNVWDYSNMPYNLMGQIALPMAFVWYFICVPLAIYMDDYLRYKLFGEKKPKCILIYYFKLLTFR